MAATMGRVRIGRAAAMREECSGARLGREGIRARKWLGSGGLGVCGRGNSAAAGATLRLQRGMKTGGESGIPAVPLGTQCGPRSGASIRRVNLAGDCFVGTSYRFHCEGTQKSGGFSGGIRFPARRLAHRSPGTMRPVALFLRPGRFFVFGLPFGSDLLSPLLFFVFE